MRRPARIAALTLLSATLVGCTLSSDPAADSVGRAAGVQVDAAEDGITLGPAVEGAPTIEFFAPVETEYEVTGPTTVTPGVVNITLTSEGNHNLALAGPGLPVALLWGDPAGEPEESLTHSVRLREGVYVYYCSVPGHRSAGMEGRIVVTSSGTPSPGGSAAASPSPVTASPTGAASSPAAPAA